MNSKKKTTKKKGLSSVVLVAVFVVGLLIMAYPSFSNWWNEHNASQAVFGYDQQVSGMAQVDCDKLFAEARGYNKKIAKLSFPFADCGKVPGYDKLLRVPSTDVMGYVTAKKLDMQLPIYHGTDESVLAVGAGHLQGSSLPTGKAGEHTVVSAHRGLPSAKLFTSLDKLEKGDTFTITVLKKTFTYRVDKISIVLPDETDELLPIKGKNYCTLMTCTPYGVNTHRLLVRGVLYEGGDDAPYIAPEAFKLDPLMVAPVVAVPLLILVVTGMIVRSRRKEEDDEAL